VICSEVLEHVASPVERAFDTLARLLAPGGVLILSVPYTLAAESVEHFPGGSPSAVAEIGGKTVLLATAGDGSYQVFDNLSFHGGLGATLEMRVYSEAALRARLTDAGLNSIQIETRPNAGYGVVFPGRGSLPVIVSRGGFQFPPHAVKELAEQISESRGILRKVRASRWMSLGRKLGLGPWIEDSPYLRGDPR
jgi:hypothetical protein